jgi:hypothetical protein
VSSAGQRLAPRSGAARLACGGAGSLGHALASTPPGRAARTVRADTPPPAGGGQAHGTG